MATNPSPYFCCGNLPDEGHTVECEAINGWNECRICGESHPDSCPDSVKACPDCERPNQFGELCESCRSERGDLG